MFLEPKGGLKGPLSMADTFAVKFIEHKKAAAAVSHEPIHVGLDHCVHVTVGFIVPCGEVEIGGCWTQSKAAAKAFLPAQATGDSVVLNTTKDADAVHKALLLKAKT